jgi:hypothetical protein
MTKEKEIERIINEYKDLQWLKSQGGSCVLSEMHLMLMLIETWDAAKTDSQVEKVRGVCSEN